MRRKALLVRALSFLRITLAWVHGDSSMRAICQPAPPVSDAVVPAAAAGSRNCPWRPTVARDQCLDRSARAPLRRPPACCADQASQLVVWHIARAAVFAGSVAAMSASTGSRGGRVGFCARWRRRQSAIAAHVRATPPTQPDEHHPALLGTTAARRTDPQARRTTFQRAARLVTGTAPANRRCPWFGRTHPDAAGSAGASCCRPPGCRRTSRRPLDDCRPRSGCGAASSARFQRGWRGGRPPSLGRP